MSNKNRSANTDPIKHLTNEFRLARGRGIRASAWPIAPAVSRSIDHDDSITLRQPISERKPHVFEIVAGAMQQNDRRRIGGTELHEMHATAVNFDKVTRGRMILLNSTRLDRGKDRKAAKHESPD
jgi:hypothetical protein